MTGWLSITSWTLWSSKNCFINTATILKAPFTYRLHRPNLRMFTEAQTRDRFQWLKPLCVFWDSMRQDKSVTSLLLEPSGRGAAVAAGTHAAEGLCAHTNWRKRSKRVGAEQGLLLQSLPWQPADRASNRQNHLHYRPLHDSTVCRGSGRVQWNNSIRSQFDCILCLTVAPRKTVTTCISIHG